MDTKIPRLTHESEIDLKPFINFLVVMIPVLMISAEFSKIAVVEASSARGGVSLDSASMDRPLLAHQPALNLSLLISDSTITLGSSNGFMPTMYYREYHTYVARDKRTNRVVVAYDPHFPKKTPVNPETGKPFGLDERETIILNVVNERGVTVRCLYAKNGGMVTDITGTPLLSVRPGDSVNVLGSICARVVVTNADAFTLRPLSVYDEVRNSLLQVHARAGAYSDGKCIRIAAEKSVVYDKIIQLMDVARHADFPDIAIAKLRS